MSCRIRRIEDKTDSTNMVPVSWGLHFGGRDNRIIPAHDKLKSVFSTDAKVEIIWGCHSRSGG